MTSQAGLRSPGGWLTVGKSFPNFEQKPDVGMWDFFFPYTLLLEVQFLEPPLLPCPMPHEAGGLPEVVAWGDTALLRNAVEPGEGVFGDALVPGLVQVAHPADLNAQNSALEKGAGVSSPTELPGPVLGQVGGWGATNRRLISLRSLGGGRR